ncbi:MAG: HD domain-containing protein [Spirochaetia bacterium]|nr:HD domain-containing protein [Spirochaetia bacterium]
MKVGQNPDDECLLVWFEDITQRQELDNKLAKIREFSNQIMVELPSLIEQDTSFQKLSGLILELGYSAVFIAKFSEDDSLTGNVYKLQDGGLVSSEKVVVSPDSKAPIWLSRKEGRITYAEKSIEQSDVEFQQQYPFDPQVTEFIGAPIENFINYHEAEVSIIAFNLDRSIGSGDVLAMEVLANSARSVSSLIGLANQNERKFMQSVTGLCAAAEYSDEITGEHILRVNRYSELLAKELGLTHQEQHQIGQVAAMHDIGKVAIPHLIKLERTFTPDERREMQMHTIFGAQIIERMMGCCSEPEPRLSMAFEIALYHHQQWNGAGYPDIIQSDGSLAELSSKETDYYAAFRPARGEEIPLVARIVSLADNYDALRSRRQYKPAKGHAETAALIRTDDRSGTAGAERFGTDVMEAFERVHPEFDVIYRNMS